MIARLRHRLGFGIHSPFAFGVVTDVVRRRGRYYADAQVSRILAAAGCSRRERRYGRLLFRLVARLEPSSLAVMGALPEPLRKCAMAADSRLISGGSLPRRLVVAWRHADPRSVAASLREGDMLAALDCPCVPSGLPGGLYLRGRRELLFFKNSRLTPVCYPILL